MERGDEFLDSVPADQCGSVVGLCSLLLATLLTWLVWRCYLSAKDSAAAVVDAKVGLALYGRDSSVSTDTGAMDFDDAFSVSAVSVLQQQHQQHSSTPPCCQVESCGGAAYCNPSYNDDDDDDGSVGDEDDDDDDDDSSSGDERNLVASASMYPLDIDETVMLPRLGFLEPIVEETSDDLRSEESRSEASGRWGWDCSSTDGAPSVIHVTPTPVTTVTTVSEVSANNSVVEFNYDTTNSIRLLPPHLGSNKDQELDKWLESSMLELGGEEAVTPPVPCVGGSGSGGGLGASVDRLDLDRACVRTGGGGSTKAVDKRVPTAVAAPSRVQEDGSQSCLQTQTTPSDNQNNHSSIHAGVTMTTDSGAAGSTGVLRNEFTKPGFHATPEVTSKSHPQLDESERVLKANSVNLQYGLLSKNHHDKNNPDTVTNPEELVDDLQLDNSDLLILFENGDNGGGDSSSDDGVSANSKETDIGARRAHVMDAKGDGAGFADWNQAIDEYLCSLVANPTWRTPPPSSDFPGNSHPNNHDNNNDKHSRNGVADWQHNSEDVFPVISDVTTDLINCSDSKMISLLHPESATGKATAAIAARPSSVEVGLCKATNQRRATSVENGDLTKLQERRQLESLRHSWTDPVYYQPANSKRSPTSISNSNPNLVYHEQQPFISTSSSLQGSKCIVDNLDLAIAHARGVVDSSKSQFDEVSFYHQRSNNTFSSDPVYYDERIATSDRVIFDDFEDEENDYDWTSSSSDEEGRGGRRGGQGLQQFHGVFEDLTQIAALGGDDLSSANSDADSDDPGRYYECFNDHVVCGDSSLGRSLSLTDLRTYSSGDGLHDDVERCTKDGSEGRTRANSGSSEPDTPSSAHTATRPSTENLSEDSGYCDTGSTATVLERADSSSPDEEAVNNTRTTQQLQQQQLLQPQQQQQQRAKYPIGVIPEDSEESEDCSATTILSIKNDGSVMNGEESDEAEKVNSARVRLEQLLLRDHDRRTDIYSDAALSDGRERTVNVHELANGESSFKKDFDLLYNSSSSASQDAGRYGNAALDDLALESAKSSGRKKRQRNIANKKSGNTISEDKFHELENTDKICGGWQEALLQREWERSVKSGRAATDDWLVMHAYVPKPRSCLKPTRSAECLMWPINVGVKEVWEDEDGTDIDGGVLSCPPSFASHTTNNNNNKCVDIEPEVGAPSNVNKVAVRQLPEAELLIVEEGEERVGGCGEVGSVVECGNGLRAKMMPDAGGASRVVERRSWHDGDIDPQAGGPDSGAGERGRRLGGRPSLALGQTHHEIGVVGATTTARSLPELQQACTTAATTLPTTTAAAESSTTDVGRSLSRAFGRLSVKARAPDTVFGHQDPATFVTWKQDNSRHHVSRAIPAATHVDPRPPLDAAVVSAGSHPELEEYVSADMNQAKWLATSPTKEDEQRKKRDPLAEVRRVQVSLASRPRPTRPPPPPPHSSCTSPQHRSDVAGAADVTTTSRVHVTQSETPLPSNVQHVARLVVNSGDSVSELSILARPSTTTINASTTNGKRGSENGYKSDSDDERVAVDDDNDDDDNGETDRAAKALEDSFRQLERAISSLEQDIGHVSPQRHTHSPWPPPDSQYPDPFYLHDDDDGATSPNSCKPLTPSRARIVDARRQFFVASPSSSTPTSPEPPSPASPTSARPDDLAAVFDSFRQRAQEGRERVARSVVDLSEIERAVRVQIDSLSAGTSPSTQAPPPPLEAVDSPHSCSSSSSRGLPRQEQEKEEREGSPTALQQSRAVRAPSASPPRGSHGPRPRSQSAAGYLETDVDTLQSREVLHVTENGDLTTTTTWQRSALFDDYDDEDDEQRRHYATQHQHHRHHSPGLTTATTSSPTKAASMLSLPGDHRPRYGQPASPARTQDEADRARSMEFLLDADNKAAAQPPENALMRGAETTRALSQHELRVRRSLQRLDVPDWFKNSPHSKSGSFLLLKRSPEPTSSGWPSSTVSSRTPSASSLQQQQTSPISGTTPTRPRAPTAPSSTTTATSVTTRVPPPYCWRYPRHSRESLQSPGSPSPSPQPDARGTFHFSRWGSTRISSSSVGGGPALSTPSPSPTGTLSRPPGSTALVHRQPYLGWRSSERLSREVASAHTTPTHFYRSAAERLSAGPGYYALRYGAYGKPGSEGNLLAPRLTPPGPPPLKKSPVISPSSKPPIPPKPVVSPTSGQYRPATTTQQPAIVTNGYVPNSSEHEDILPKLQQQYQDTSPTTAKATTCPATDSQLQSPPKSPRQRVIWMESSFVGVKPGKGSPTPANAAPPASSSTGSSPNRKSPSPAHDTSPSGGYRSKSSLVSGGSDDIRLTKAKRSFGQIHDEEGSSRDSSSPVATLEEVLDSLLAIPSGGSRSASPSTRGAGRFYVADGDSSSDADSRRSSSALLDGESMVKVDGAPAGVSPPLPPPRSHSSSSSSCNSEPSSRSGSFSAGRLAQGLSDRESPHRLHQHLQHCSPLPETPSAPPLEDCTSPQPSPSPHANDDECETDLGRLAGDEDLADNDVILVDRRGSHPRPPTPPPRSLAPDAASSSPVGAPPTLHHVHWGTLPVTNTSAPAPEGEPGEAGGESGTEEASARRRGSEQLRNLLPDDLLVRCSFPRCAKTVAWAEARRSFKTCHNCYTYYCSRECRRLHWDKHRRTCMYSRVRSLCRHVILHSHDDVSVRAHLSKLARTGVLTQGRGFIKIGFRNPELAERFLQNGWSALEDNPIYMAWRDLLPQEFGADIYHEMSEMCKSYNPEVKFILLVAVYVTREIPAQPVPRWEREIIAKCAKMPLRKPGGPSGDEYGDPSLEPDTLILTAVPAPSTDLQASPRQARHHCFTNIQRHLGQRGVSLRHQFPDVFDKLSNYVERDELFPPITIYPKDGRTGKTFMCLIMASTEPEIEAVVRDFARKT